MKHRRAKQTFPIIIEEQRGGGYVVVNPLLDGCYSQGDTIEEALANIREATELCLAEKRPPTKSVSRQSVGLHLIEV